jgi:prepilin-type processing-associated H-X9-DG protein
VLGRSNYVAMGGYPHFSAGSGTGNGQFAGIFTYQSKTKMGEMQDGTSNTMLFGEYSSGYVDFGAGNILTGNTTACWAAGMLYTYWDPDRSQDPAPGVHYRLGSKHPGILNVAFADGSVTPLQRNISTTLWISLGGMKDGTVVTRN